MQPPALAVSRDRYDIESLRQQKPNGFTPTLLNAAATGGVKSITRTSLAPIRSRASDCARHFSTRPDVQFAASGG
jgi:hypothetical protein